MYLSLFPSPTQTILQDFGMGKIYSRPGIKGRQLLGQNTELVPLGKVLKRDDVVRIKAPVAALNDKLETFTMQFAKRKL